MLYVFFGVLLHRFSRVRVRPNVINFVNTVASFFMHPFPVFSAWQGWFVCVFGQDELRLFYQCFCPPMVPKAKGMVVLNVSRQEVLLLTQSPK